MNKIENSTLSTAKFTRVGFLCLFPGLYRKTLLTINENKGK